MSRQKPMLMESPLTDCVYIVTSYVDNGNGMFTARQKYDVTEQFEAIAKHRERSAEQGGGTCENVWAKFGKFKCSECAMEVNAISTNTTTPRPIAFCPNCGARIRKAVE